MDEVRLGDASIKILPVVRGLSSEIPIVANAINTTAPNVVAVSIGPEELQTLRSYHGGPLEPENFEEEIYVAGLSAWETPTKPPPCFTEAIRVADRRGARLEALDMDEVTYTETYVNCVSGLCLGSIQKKINSRDVASHKTDLGQRSGRGVQISSTEQEIHILSIAYRRLIHCRNP